LVSLPRSGPRTTISGRLMRILHVASEYPPQQVFGLGRYVHELALESARQGHVVHVLTNSMGEGTADTVDEGVAVHRVHFPPPPKPPGDTAPALAFNVHLLQRAHALGTVGLGQPEIVVSHDWLTAIAGERLARRLHIPHAWTVHDTVRGKLGARPPESTDVVSAGIERWAAQQADLILVNSSAVRNEVMLDGAEAEHIRILPCGIDCDRFASRQRPERLAHFRTLFAAPNEILITYVGRLDLEKGIDTLINACARLQQERLPFRLAIAGKGVLAETIQEHVAALGLQDRVRLWGYLSGEVLKAFYAISDLHVCPSHYEPFGLVALEAMAAAKPVVVSATGGLLDIVTTDAVGRTVPPRDITALAHGLAELVRDSQLRQSLGQAALAHARERFSWRRIAEQACDAYASVCGLVGVDG
jgi:1,4-alpha-glucan branching enzyme